MPDLFTMRLTAPLASLSGPRIDTASDHLPIPSRSMITGIIGAALGLGYDQPEILQQVQNAMRLAVVVHREGRVIRDYQTVRMGLPHMIGPMWWYDGKRLGIMKREGGDPERTITGERPLICDYDATIIIDLFPGSPFSAREILKALRTPVHPLCVGQRSCIPSLPIAGETLNTQSLSDAVSMVPPGTIYLPAECVTQSSRFGDLYVSVPAGRDWTTREHGGSDTYVVRTRSDAFHVQHSA
jgi:CRISPR system Cascade subunit CasD